MTKDKDNKDLIKINLQFFAEGEGGEKTEEASAKKLDQARKEGQVAKSNELVMAISIMTLFLSVKVFIEYVGDGFFKAYRESFNYIANIGKEEFTIKIGSVVMKEVMVNVIKIAIPFYLSAMISAIVVNISQFKWQVTAKPLKPKFEKINPLKGLKRMFSKDKIAELIKAILKILVISIIVYTTINGHVDALTNLYSYTLTEGVKVVGDLVISLGIKIGALLMVIGFADLFYQKKKFKKDMMMTKEEVKQEMKQTELPSEVKQKIRSKMTQMSQKRMMQQVPQADVVITNPTHLAVALKFDIEVGGAPIVVAKGEDIVAQRIKKIAKDNGVMIYEDKPLARMLYYNVELGQEIPPELYRMVADVLVYVYKEREIEL